MRSTDTFELHSEIRFRRVADEAIVIRQDTGELLVFNDLGGAVLELIDSRRSAASIIERLQDEYDVTRAQLEPDILSFLQELMDLGVTKVCTGAQ